MGLGETQRAQNVNAADSITDVFLLTGHPLLPLDEAIASRAVFAIVSGSGWQTGGRKRFWSQLNNSNTVRDRPYVSMGS